MVDIHLQPCDAEQVTALDPPFVSVIVPVFNDAERLQVCLAALEKQTYPPHCYEVIVVDNASDPAQQIATVVAQFKQAIAAFEQTPGSYAARNTGIALAQGDIIAFTDADCIPADNWIEKGVNALLQSPECGMVTGTIDIFFRDPEHPTSVELYERILALPQKEFVEKYHYAATANVFTFRRIIHQVGQFDPTLKSSGDVEWGQRIYAHGFKQIYADDIRVAHPARHTLAQLRSRTRRIAGGQYDLLAKTTPSVWRRNGQFWVGLVQDLVPPVMFTINLFNDSRLPSVSAKLRVASVMCYVRAIRAWEKIKLKLGGVSARE